MIEVGSMLPAVVLAMLSGAMMIAQFVIAKALRDSLFLSNFPATLLPNAVIGTALATLPAVLAGSRLMARIGPQPFLRAFLLINALAFAGEWLALPVLPRLVAGILYLHVGLFGGLALSGFWSVVNERFDPHAARSVFARISLGVTFGGLLGGIVAERLATWFGVRAMLLALVVTNLGVVVSLLGIGDSKTEGDEAKAEGSGLTALARSPYLQRLAALVVLGALSSSTVDYAFKATLATAIGQPERLAKFFAVFYMTTGFATVVVQSTATRFSLERFGIGVTLSILPVVLLLGGTISLLVGGLTVVVALRGAEAILSASFFRSAYEPLYTPLAPTEKRSTKAIIDVAADRLGDALGSVCVLVGLVAVPSFGWAVALVAAMLAAVGTWLLAQSMQRGYVSALAHSLRVGSVRLSDSDVKDATTRLTLSQTHGEIDRIQLLRELAVAKPELFADPELAREATELLSGDVERIVLVLEARPFDKRLVGFVLPLLAVRDTRDYAVAALSAVAPEVVGQLGDALNDAKLPTSARLRVPLVLSDVRTSRSVRALTEGLMAGDFELRQRCARALLKLRLQDPALTPPEAVVVSAVGRELDVSPATWKLRSVSYDPDDQEPEHIPELRGNRGLQHVFTLLCLCRPPDVMALALRALGSDDMKLRGTALEYLDNVTPPEVKAPLWEYLPVTRPQASKPQRTDRELTEELKRSFVG